MALRMDGSRRGHQLGKRQPGKKGEEGFVDGCGRKRKGLANKWAGNGQQGHCRLKRTMRLKKVEKKGEED